jgi:hypothetical protein
LNSISRIKECPGIIEPSTVILEVIPNFEDKLTTFMIKKDRFGLQGQAIDCAFDKGRYVEITAEHLKKVQQEKLLKLQNMAGISDDDERRDNEEVSGNQGDDE